MHITPPTSGVHIALLFALTSIAQALVCLFASLYLSLEGNQATNNQPCVFGKCTWSGGDNVNSLYSTLSISGPLESIGDVTPATGWNIQGCDPNWSNGTHSVQMVCAGSADQTQYCDHIFQGGAEDTIVRLPDNCGTNPFARVTNMTKMNDSTKNYLLDMDYRLSNISSSHGPVSYSLIVGDGLTPTASNNASLQSRFMKSDKIQFSLQKSGIILNKPFSGPGPDPLGLTVSGTVDISGYVILGAESLGHFGIGSDIQFMATLVASGSIIFDLDSSIQGPTGSETKPFLDIPEKLSPGLHIDGVVSITPTIQADASVDFDFESQTTASINAQLDLSNVQFVFPPDRGQPAPQASFGPNGQNPVQFNLNPGSSSIDGSLTGHIIPKINVAISLLDGLFSADIFLESDLSANLTITSQRPDKRDYPRSSMKRQDDQVCVASDAGIDIIVGVSGSIASFGPSKNITIFSGSLPLFEEGCPDNIGNDVQRREIGVESPQNECPTPSEFSHSLQRLF